MIWTMPKDDYSKFEEKITLGTSVWVDHAAALEVENRSTGQISTTTIGSSEFLSCSRTQDCSLP